MKMNSAQWIVRESIELAMVKLLNKKKLPEITIKELTEYAGVSRVSFYRNYRDKEDVLYSYMWRIADEWEEQTKKQGITDDGEKILGLFERERKLLKVTYENGLEFMIYKLIRKTTGLENLEAKYNVEAYFVAGFAGFLFGWCDEWVRRGMKEEPEEIKEMLAHLIKERQNLKY